MISRNLRFDESQYEEIVGSGELIFIRLGSGRVRRVEILWNAYCENDAKNLREL